MLGQKLGKFKLNNFFRKKKSGFSLIELLLVFVLLMGMTTLFLRQVAYKKKASIQDLAFQVQEVTQKVFYTSIIEGKVYAMHLFFEENKLLTDIAYGEYNTNNPSGEGMLNKKKIKNPFRIESFFVNGKDEMLVKSKQIWVLFYPDGHCQEITFSIVDKDGKEKYSFMVNPFTGSVEDAL